jgi:hypothetical protein
VLQARWAAFVKVLRLKRPRRYKDSAYSGWMVVRLTSQGNLCWDGFAQAGITMSQTGLLTLVSSVPLSLPGTGQVMILDKETLKPDYKAPGAAPIACMYIPFWPHDTKGENALSPFCWWGHRSWKMLSKVIEDLGHRARNSRTPKMNFCAFLPEYTLKDLQKDAILIIKTNHN